MDDFANELDSAPFSRRVGWWLACSGALGAAAVSGYLLYLTTRPDAHLRGCGGGGCSEAWASKWSTLFGLPVAAGALGVYLLILVLLFSRRQAAASRWAALWGQALVALTVAVLLSILYFMALQGFVVGSWCKWCLAAHGLGLATAAGVALQRPWRAGEDAGVKPMALAGAAGFGLFVVLAGLQAIDPGPDTHKIVDIAGDTTENGTDPDAVGGHAGRSPVVIQDDPDTLRLPDGGRVARGFFPTIGPTDARLVVFKLYDYTCDSCRDLHNDLEAIWPELQEDAALVLVPCPLHRACHPGLPAGVENHTNACELARIGMAVWFAAPEQFHTYHRWAFENRPAPAAAEAYAADLVGAAAISAALAEPGQADALEIATRLFASAGGPRMPKLFLPDGKLMVGVTRHRWQTQLALERLLERAAEGE